MFILSFKLIGLSGEAKNIFSKWTPWWPSLISDRNYLLDLQVIDASCQVSSQLASRFRRRCAKKDFQDFLSTSYLDASYPISSQLVQGFRKKLINFQDSHNCRRCGYLGFLMGTILAIFYLQLTPILPAKYQINMLSLQKRKIDFQDGGHGSHLGFPIENVFANSDLSHPNASYQVSSQLVLGCWRSRLFDATWSTTENGH